MDTRLDDPGRLWSALRAAKWLILAAALLVAVATYAYYERQPRTYVSDATMLLGTSQVKEFLGGGTTPETTDRAVANQAALLNSEQFASGVQRRLARQTDGASDAQVTVVPGQGTDVLTIEARSPSAEGSAATANAYAKEYISFRQRQVQEDYQAAVDATQRQADGLTGVGTAVERQRRVLLEQVNELRALASAADPGARLVDPAEPAAAPIAPRPSRSALFAFILGLGLASGAVLLRARLDRRIRSLRDAEEIFERPVVAAIPPLRREGRARATQRKPGGDVLQRVRSGVRKSWHRVGGRPPPEPDPRAKIERLGLNGASPSHAVAQAEEAREPLRRLLTTLELERRSGSAWARTVKVLVTSAQRGEGKSVVACNLALVAREAGLRVAVVDVDLIAPSQSGLLGVERAPGLSDVLAGRIAVDEAWQRVNARAVQPATLETDGGPVHSAAPDGEIQAAPDGEIQVLASGTSILNPAAPVASPAIESVLYSRDGEVDYVFIDAPPPLAVSDALPLLSSVDKIVVVTRLGHATHSAAQRLATLLESQSAVPVVGLVATGVPEDESAAFGFERYSS